MTIEASVVASSNSSYLGKRRDIATFVLEYPRFIHAEFMTHRLFSRNAASSRAIPVLKSIELIRENTARPIHWGKNQPGMSAKEECRQLVSLGGDLISREEAWDQARDRAIEIADAFNKAGYHKQIVNRILEPFSHIKVVLTATDLDNWFWLRNHKDAQPEIQMLAAKMLAALDKTPSYSLSCGEWHTPFYGEGYWSPADKVSLDDALAISSSCAAQVSYRKADDSLEKAREIYKRLVDSKPVHASPFEHQATPIVWTIGRNHSWEPNTWEAGVTHVTRESVLCSGNFKGWIQHRQLIPGHECTDYNEAVAQDLIAAM